MAIDLKFEKRKMNIKKREIRDKNRKQKKDKTKQTNLK